MKKLFIAFFLIGVSIQLSAQNQSASFERNNEGFYTHASGDLEVDHDNSSDEAFEGQHSLELFILNNGSGNLQFLCKKFDVNPGDQFDVKFQIKSNQNRNIRAKSQFSLDNKKVKVVLETPIIEIGEEWKTVEFTVEVSADFEGAIPKLLNVGFIEMKIKEAKGLSYYIDDFQITPSK